MKRLIATVLFIAFLPFATLIIACQIICQETWSALRSIYLEFRVELADLPRQWRKLRSRRSDR